MPSTYDYNRLLLPHYTPVRFTTDLLEYGFNKDHDNFKGTECLIFDLTLEYITKNWEVIRYNIEVKEWLKNYSDVADSIANVVTDKYDSTGSSLMQDCISERCDLYIKDYLHKLDGILLYPD
jgi:hypothetical protein